MFVLASGHATASDLLSLTDELRAILEINAGEEQYLLFGSRVGSFE